MSFVRVEQGDITDLLMSGRAVGAVGTVGSGLWDFEDDFPEVFTSLEPKELKNWHGDVMLFFSHHLAAELIDWLKCVDPSFDAAQLKRLPPRTALLFEAQSGDPGGTLHGTANLTP